MTPASEIPDLAWLTVVAQCKDCGRWSEHPELDMNLWVTISRDGLAGIFARCRSHRD